MTFWTSHIASATKMHSKIDVGIFRNIMMATMLALILSSFSFNFDTKTATYDK